MKSNVLFTSSILLSSVLAACAGTDGQLFGSHADLDAHSQADLEDGGSRVATPAGPQGLLLAHLPAHADAFDGAGGGQYSTIVVQESDFYRLSSIRDANPDAIVLAALAVDGIERSRRRHPSSGVSLRDRTLESWYLHDARGKKIRFCDDDSFYAADVGAAGYRDSFVANAVDRVVADGFDGVFLVGVNTTLEHCLGDQTLQEYGTDAAFGDAMVDFVNDVGPRLQRAGLLVAADVHAHPWHADQGPQGLAMLPALTHYAESDWMRWERSDNWTGAMWSDNLSLMEAVQDAGVALLASTPGSDGIDDAAGQRYGRASFLLAWDGSSDSAWGFNGAAADPFGDDWLPDVGFPSADAVAEGQGWKRVYSDGIVLVNPGAAGAQAFDLGGSYLDADGNVITSLSLDAGQGVALAIAPESAGTGTADTGTGGTDTGTGSTDTGTGGTDTGATGTDTGTGGTDTGTGSTDTGTGTGTVTDPVPYGFWGLNGYLSTSGLTDVGDRTGMVIIQVASASPTYTVNTLLPMAQAAGMKVTLRMTGSHSRYTDGSGGFDIELWKDQLDVWAGSGIQAYIDDGTLVGHMILDDIGTFAGHDPTGDELEEMAAYSKAMMPGLMTYVRQRATEMPVPSAGVYTTVDACVNQYRVGFGPIADFVVEQQAAAADLDLGIINGLNIANGGDGSSGQPGWATGKWAMSADEILDYGSQLAAMDGVGLFLNWEYDGQETWTDGSIGADYFRRADVEASLADLGDIVSSYEATPLLR